MTVRAPKDEGRPLRRLVLANGEELIVELHERRVVFRYPRARKPVVEAVLQIRSSVRARRRCCAP